MIRSRSRFVALAAVAAFLLSACGGGGGAAPVELAGVDVASGLEPDPDGFAFANFSAGKTGEEFGAEDLVKMFGNSADVCVDGASPCDLVAEAAAWARLVNDARTSGHCEGLVVTSSTRYSSGASPATAQLANDGDVTHAIFRAFATQFLKEVQDDTAKWAKKSLREKLAALETAFASRKVTYTLGVYTSTGGHAVLPYAVVYESPTVAKVKVYDSNWPGQERYVRIDLEKDQWSFSFSGKDPGSDPKMWTGGSPDLDLTSMEARTAGKCPFCASGAELDESMFVVRNAALDWSMTTTDGTLSPTSMTAGEGRVRPLRAGSSVASDFVVTVPAGETVKIDMPSSTKITGITPQAAVEIVTPGSSDASVEVTDDSIKSDDPSVAITLADGNLVGTSNGASSEIVTSGGELEMSVTTTGGENINVTVDADRPAVEITTAGNPALPDGVEYRVESEVGDGKIEQTTMTDDGKKSTVEIDGELENTKPSGSMPDDLAAPDVKEGLPPADDRRMTPTKKTQSAPAGQVSSTQPPALRPVARPD